MLVSLILFPIISSEIHSHSGVAAAQAFALGATPHEPAPSSGLHLPHPQTIETICHPPLQQTTCCLALPLWVYSPLPAPLCSNLCSYEGAWDAQVDAWLVVRAKDPEYAFNWRLQAEQAMRAQGKPAMTDEQVGASARRTGRLGWLGWPGWLGWLGAAAAWQASRYGAGRWGDRRGRVWGGDSGPCLFCQQP